ncbi:MAG TPA: NUDIX domain-containing protein [Thermoplasmata archaeon]|nr:NUDIX domain-containing protein [Thermoplasmata archaeon]
MAPESVRVAQECVEGYLFTRNPDRILILRRPPARGSIWVPVSGKVEPTDADFEAALRRELVEETGIDRVESVTPLDWQVPFDGPDGRTWRLHAFSVALSRPTDPRLSPEHDAFEWVGPDEAIRRLHYEDNREVVRRLFPDSSERRTAVAGAP